MKHEVSAGGIVIKNTKVLLLRDMSDNWTFPKGLIEKGETQVKAAIREIGEEVGLTKLTFVTKISPITYVYRRGSLITKTVHYFLFRHTGRETIVCQKSEGIQEAKWFAFDKAFLRLGYPKTNVPLLTKALKLL